MSFGLSMIGEESAFCRRQSGQCRTCEMLPTVSVDIVTVSEIGDFAASEPRQ